MEKYWSDELRNDIFADGFEIITPFNGVIPGVRMDSGIGSFWIPNATEKAAIAADQPVLLFFPGLTDHPGVVIHALSDPSVDPTRDIPDAVGFKRVLCVGGPLDGEWNPASNERGNFYNIGTFGDPDYPRDPNLPSSYELYCHIPGDPENEFRHAASYVLATTPGVDYIEQNENIQTEFEEISAWRIECQKMVSANLPTPQLDTLTTPIDRMYCHLSLIAYGYSVPQNGP